MEGFEPMILFKRRSCDTVSYAATKSKPKFNYSQFIKSPNIKKKPNDTNKRKLNFGNLILFLTHHFLLN